MRENTIKEVESYNIMTEAGLKTTHPSQVDSSGSLTPEQKRAVELLGKDICVSAGAGSGKTGVLVERFVNLVVKEGLHVSEILCITFTDKAAGQMKQRIAERFHSPGKEQHRQEVEFAYISTIDSFCSRLLRENALEAGLDPDFVILKEYEAGFLQRSLAENLLVQWETVSPDGYNLLIEELYCRDLAESAVELLAKIRSSGLHPKDIPVKNDILSELNETLKSIYLCIKRIEDLLTDLPPSSKQRENTERALAELKHLKNLRPEEIKAEHVTRLPEIELRVGKTLKENLKILEDLLKRLKQQYWENVTIRTKLALKEFLSQLLQLYQEEKKRRSVLDFNDLIENTVDLLRTFPSLREGLRSKFRHILVDEFQDTNNLQRILLEMLKREGNLFVVGDAQQSIYGFRYADLEVFLEHMSQTKERGGEIVHLDRNFRSRPEVLCFVNQVFKAQRAFSERSESNGNDSTGWRPLLAGSAFSPKESPSVELILARGEKIEDARKVEAHLLANRIQEIVQNGELKITRSNSNRPLTYGDFAILFRSITDIKLFEEALEEMGIPFFVMSGKGLYDAREVIDLVNLLQLIDNPLDEVKLVAVLRSPFAGIDDHTLFWLAHYAKNKGDEKPLFFQLDELDSVSEINLYQKERLLRFRESLERFRGLKERLSIASLIENILAKTHYDSRVLAFPGGRQSYANLRKFTELTREFEKRGILGLPQFLRDIRDLRVAETRESEAPTDLEVDNVVKILTIHKAKGLEFPVVAVADLGRGKQNRQPDILFSRKGGLGLKIINPLTKKPEATASFEEIEQEIKIKAEGEEERVFYVALTRAQEHLILSGSYTEKISGEPLKQIAETLNLSLDSDASNGESAFGEEKYKLRLTLEKVFSERMPPPLKLSYNERGRILRGEPLEVSHDGAEVPLPACAPIPKQASQKDYIYSVTEIVCYHRCPRLYYFRYKLGLPSIESEEIASSYKYEKPEDELDGSHWTRLGSTAHRALELYRPSEEHGSSGLDKVVLQALEETLPGTASREQVNVVKEWVQNFYSSREGQIVLNARDVRHEMPFIFNYNGIPVRGKVDLLFSPEDKVRHGESAIGTSWYLLDFKSSNPPQADPEVLESYSIQMRLYSMAVRALFGTLPAQAMLFFLPEAKSEAIDITPEAMEQLDEWLKTFFSAQEEENFPAYRRRDCRWCEYRKYCGEAK